MTVKRLLLTAGVVLTLIIIIGTIGWMNNQQNNVQSLESRLDQMQATLDEQIQSNFESIKEELTKTIQMENSNVSNPSYTIKSYDSIKNEVLVTVKFQLKNYKQGEKVQVLYDNSEKSSDPIEATLNGNMFQVDLSLNLNSSIPYAINYSTVSEQVINAKIMEIDLQSDLYSRFKVIEVSVHDETKDKMMFFKFEEPIIHNFYSENEKLKLTSCIIEIYDNNKLIKSYDITNKLQTKDGYQSFEPIQKDSTFFTLQGEDKSVLDSISYKIKATDGYGIPYDLLQK